MKHVLLIFLITVPSILWAQQEKQYNREITDRFVKNYNSNNFDAIFLMFTPAMQAALPIVKTQDFLKGLKSQAGNIAAREFVKYENGYACYKTNFEKNVLMLNIAIDVDKKIDGLFVRPFVETSVAHVRNELTISDGILTKAQTEIIFEKTKDFPDQTQIAIAIIENGVVRYYGVKRHDDAVSTVKNHQSIFEIGSITKVFTSTLLADFVVNKRISLNDNVNDYLKLPFNNGVKISFVKLSNHSSGLPPLPSNLDLSKVDPLNPYKAYVEADLNSYLTTSLVLPPNQIGQYQYSNLGAGLIGYTLSKIEGVSYESLLQDRIFKKYGMVNSTTMPQRVKAIMVKGLDAEGNEVPNWDLSVLVGAGGILSNVEDLSKFAFAQFNSADSILALTRKKTFDVNNNMEMGLGWHIISSKSGGQWHWHNGGTGGYSSSMAIDTKIKNGIIILSNVSAFSPLMANIDKLCFGLMETLKDK